MALRVFFCIALSSLLVSPMHVHAEEKPASYVDLLAFVNENKLQLSWDVIYEVGIISDGRTMISFRPALAQITVNFTEVHTVDPLVLNDGVLSARPTFLKVVEEIFFRERKRTIKDNVVKAEQKEENEAEETKRETESNTLFTSIGAIIIDAGHGGKDPGVVATHTHQGRHYRILEKTIALHISKRVESLLRKHFPHLKIVMTRRNDKYVSLEERIVVANTQLQNIGAHQAVLFVSIHGNAAPSEKSNGYEVWYLPPEYRRNLVNKTDIEHEEIYAIINNLREEEVSIESIQLAKSVIRGMSQALGGLSKNRGVKEEKWYVVRNAKMPAVLIETGFLTHPQEGAMLSKVSYQEKVARGIVGGITMYMEAFDVSGNNSE